MKENFPPGRHSANRTFNPDFDKEDRLCGYEHCIEGTPFSDQGIDCPVFGHDCPGGISQVETCRKTKGRLRSVSLALAKVQELTPKFPHQSSDKKTGKDAGEKPFSLDEIVGSHFSKLMMTKVHLGLLAEGEKLKEPDLQDALRGCTRILEEFLDEVKGILPEEKGK